MRFLNSRRLKILCTLFLILFGGQSWSQQTINVIGEEFPPMTNADGSGQQFEVVKAIFVPMGYEVITKVYPYKRAIYVLENGHADMFVGLLKDSELKLVFSKSPHDADNVIVIYPKDKEIKWQGIKTLQNKNVAVIAGLQKPLKKYVGDGVLALNEVDTREQAYKKMLIGRDDFLIDCECGYLLKEVEKYREKFTFQEIGQLEIFAAFNQNGKALKLKAIWDEKFPQFILTEKAQNIYRKWGLLREYDIIKKVQMN
jgi:polar amino acid transport system substrate-binding protein